MVRMSDVASGLQERLRTLIETERERFGVPGAAVLVLHKGEVVLAEGFGLRDVEQQLPVTADTLFPIGSSTKTFTSAVCASLVDSKLLDWDAPLTTYLPGFRMQDPVATQLLSVRDCLSHRSGLPRHDILWYGSDGYFTREDIIDALAHLQPSKPFRELWQYNNLLYITAGTLAGRILGCTYEEAVSAQILKPLGMVRTNFDVEQNQADADHATPYVREFGGETGPVPYASLGVAGPAGNINSCVNEMLPWVRTLLGLGVDGAPPLLSRSVLDDLKRPTMPVPTSPLAADSPSLTVGYGLGLQIFDYRGMRLTQHGGNIDGFSSEVTTVEEHGIAVVVLTNLGTNGMRDAVPLAVIDELLGLDPLPHGERINTLMNLMLEQMSLVKQAVAQPPAGYPPVRPLEDYLGTYVNPAYGPIVVEAAGDGLVATFRNFAQGSLVHSTLDVFTLNVPAGGTEQPVPLQFLHDIKGEVDSLRAGFEPTVDPIVFTRQAETELSAELIAEAVGSYSLGSIVVEIARTDSGGLQITIGGVPSGELLPLRGRKLKVAASGTVVEVLDGALRTAMGDMIKQ